jgi:predicted membrane protein
MNKDFKNGLLVAGGAILLYLLYKKFSTKEEAVKEQPNTVEQPVEQRGVGVALPLVPKKPYMPTSKPDRDSFFGGVQMYDQIYKI